MIDPGTENGERIALKGEGDEKVRIYSSAYSARSLSRVQPDIPPGDVIFLIRIKFHPQLVPLPNHVLNTVVRIRLIEALLGFKRVIFRHLDGRGIQIEVRRGERIIRQGEELLVLGEGMPIRNTSRKGDLKIHFDVEMPGPSWALSQDPSVSLLPSIRSLLPSTRKTMLKDLRRVASTCLLRSKTSNRCQK